MDDLNFVVIWNNGEEPKCDLITQDRGLAMKRFETLMQNPKLDQIKLYGPSNPTRRWEPAEKARIVQENNKRLKDEAEAEANKAKDEAKKRLADAQKLLKEAEAAAKELGVKA